MSNLSEAISEMRNMRESYNQIAGAAEAYNVGKTQLAQNITSKGVPASASETLPELAEKVSAIAQESYIIQGGEMYAKQLFGSLETPNYWNLYEVLANLLSDGRLVQYGGILLAEYYRGYDSLALSGAGAGGAYVVSDKDANGQFKMYTSDTTHVWATEFDGKGNRWVAYCFADEYHDFQITDTNTSPHSIFIGRKVGTITSLVDGRVSEIVVPDGNELLNITGNYAQQWDKRVVIRNLGNFSGVALFNSPNVESAYIHIKKMTGGTVMSGTTSDVGAWLLSSVVFVIENSTGGVLFGPGNSRYFFNNINTLTVKANGSVYFSSRNKDLWFGSIKDFNIISDNLDMHNQGASGVRLPSGAKVHLSYVTNTKSGHISLADDIYSYFWRDILFLELQNEWCMNVNISKATSLSEEIIYTYILQRLKQDEPDCGDGVTITLGSTNLAKLTSEESVQLLDDLTNIYGYTFA